MRISRLLFAATILGGSEAYGQKWIDAKTGETVQSGPIVGHVEVTGSKPEPSGAGPSGYREYESFGRPTGDWVQVAVRPDATDPDHAFDPESGRNFVFDHEKGQWLDAKTGETVQSGPIVGHVEVTGSKPEPSGAGPSGYREYQTFGRPTGNWVQVAVRPDAADSNHAFDAQSGRNFVRVDIQSENLKPTNQVGSNPQQLKPFDERILDMQNAERTALGLQPFQWNPVLAQHAQDYANQLAQTGQLAHSSREGRGVERENLNQGMLGWGPDQMLQNWLKEKQHLVPGTFPNVSDTGNWLDVGHITQILWPTTTDVGCGDATGSGFQWLVCRYSPGGNKDGVGVGFAAAGGVGPATAITGVALAAGSAPPVAGANAKPPDANGLDGPVNVRIDDSWGSYRGPAVQRPTPAPPVIHIGRDTPTFPAGPGSSYARNATNYVQNAPNYNYGYRRGQNAAYGVLSDAVIGGLTTPGSQPQKPAESGNHPAVTPPKIDLVKDITPEPVSTPPSPIANNDDRMNQMAANPGSPTHLWSGLNTDAAVPDPLGHLHRRSAIAYFDVSANAWCLGAFICGAGTYSSGYIGNWNNDVVFPSMGIPSEPAGSGGAMIFGFTGNIAYPSVTMTVGDSSAPSSIPVVLAGQDVLDDFIMNIPGTAAIGVSPTITIDTNVLPPDLPGMEFSQPQPERPELEKM